MTGWLTIGALALFVFACGAFLLRSQRSLWTLLASVIVFGLAGYAWQGAPDYASAPAQAREAVSQGGEGLVDARRSFFEPSAMPSQFVIVADGLTRQGEFERAAGILAGVVARNPQDGEAWLALHVALVEHAGGRLTEPAELALRRATDTLDDNLGPVFFAGVVALRMGDLPQAREIWSNALDEAENDVAGRAFMAERLAALDQLMVTVAAQQAVRQNQPEDASPVDGLAQ
jgi:cytochrome c-type biogenesis protein CcmH